MAKKITQNRKEYNKQVKRIKDFARRALKRGYIVDVSKVINPNQQRIRKETISRLKDVTPDKLYKISEWVDVETGEILKGTEARKIERSKAAKKGAETKRRKKEFDALEYHPSTGSSGVSGSYTDQGRFIPDNINTEPDFFSNVIIGQFKAHVKSFRQEVQDLLTRWLNRIIQEHGKQDTAIMLEKGAEAGNILTWEIAYDSMKLNTYLARMLDYLPEAGTLFREEMADAFELMEDFNFYT